MEVSQSHLQEVYINDICYLVGVVKELVVIKAILIYITCSFIPPGSLVPDIGLSPEEVFQSTTNTNFQDAETLNGEDHTLVEVLQTAETNPGNSGHHPL